MKKDLLITSVLFTLSVAFYILMVVFGFIIRLETFWDSSLIILFSAFVLLFAGYSYLQSREKSENGEALYTSGIQVKAILIVLVLFSLIFTYNNFIDTGSVVDLKVQLLAAIVPFYISITITGRCRIREKGIFSFQSSIKWTEIVDWYCVKNDITFKSDKSTISWHATDQQLNVIHELVQKYLSDERTIIDP